MKNTKNLFLNFLFITMIAFAVTSCSDDGNDTPPENNEPTTKTGMITNGTWIMNSGTITPPVEVDIFGTVVTISTYWELLAAINGTTDAEPCVKDNLMIFNADSTLVLDEGASKCDDADPQTEDGGNWMFNKDETKITFSAFPYDPQKQERTLDIIELTNSTMVLNMDYTFKGPTDTTDHKIELNFKKN